jgi:secreted trypsin-like serine protease
MRDSLQAVVLIVILSFASTTVDAQQSRIINGKPASTATYPWLASLFITSESDSQKGGGCGGSLIASRWVLTAAHCFLNEAGDKVSENVASRTKMTLGSSNIANLSSSAIVVSAVRVIIHPNYNPNKVTSANTHDFDIALVELERSVNVTPVKLFTGSVPRNVPAIVAGWGATVGDGSESSDDLLATQLLTVDDATCASAHEGFITNNMLCAGGFTATDTSDTCQGDSGGPLFVMLEQGAVQLGITSFGGSDTSNCGTPGSPGVYAKLSQLISFVDLHVANVSTLASLSQIRVRSNIYDPVSDIVTIPKVYVGTDLFSVTLQHTGNLNFTLATAQPLSTDDATAIPSFFDGAANVLILPQVKVGADTFNVRLKHLGDFKFALETADAI